MKKKKENSKLKGFKLGVGIAIGVIAVIISFFLLFDVGIEMKFEPVAVDGENAKILTNPTITTSREKENSFCPNIENVFICNGFVEKIFCEATRK